MTPEGLRSSSATLLPAGAVLFTSRAPIGYVAIAANELATNQGFKSVVPYVDECGPFIAVYFRAFAKWIDSTAPGTTFREVSGKAVASLPFPLPPLAEQHRIVAKVDELMALCDRLEAAQAQRESRRDRLVSASLQRLSQPAADPTAFRDHARFHLDHLPRLATRVEHVQQLRKTILDLAMRGRLVEQDERDPDASEFIARVETHRSRVAKESAARMPRRAVSVGEDGGTYPIPGSWRWVRFGEAVISRDGERIPVSKEERSRRPKLFDYYGASGVIDKIDGYLFDKPLLLVGEDGANLVNRSTPIAFIARGKYWVNNHAHVLDGITEKFLRFLELQINAMDLKPYLTGMAQPKMNQAKMNSIPIALPPEAEQHRIVAKVDQLMAVCDQLEAAITTAQSERRRLLEAVLYEALQQAA